MRWRHLRRFPSTSRGTSGKVQLTQRAAGADFGARGAGPRDLVAAELAARQGDHASQLRIQLDRLVRAERNPPDPGETRVRGQAQLPEECVGLAGESPGAGLGADLLALLRHQDLTPGLGQDLSRAKAGRPRTDDQVLDALHEGSSRIRAAAAALSASVGLEATPVRRSHIRALR